MSSSDTSLSPQDVRAKGLARSALTHVLDQSTARRLWCLADNHRARGFYQHLGWHPSGSSRPVEWPPYPLEIELAVTSH
ncbi:GNAT family N-acetyltransferase [Solicola sp. PLA-1-18]|uniref:GNAT family N-acetyltransferase n=1 Tax=Solicola sp. PLA-1-18 TaxID=3380532 RepID=UPI003B79E94C